MVWRPFEDYTFFKQRTPFILNFNCFISLADARFSSKTQLKVKTKSELNRIML